VEEYAMMNTIKRFAKADEDGVLKIELPVGIANVTVECVIVWHQVLVDDNGWPAGFIDRTYGALADDPIDEIEQLPLEERDEID
jgi:hypothetical protein